VPGSTENESSHTNIAEKKALEGKDGLRSCWEGERKKRKTQLYGRDARAIQRGIKRKKEKTLGITLAPVEGTGRSPLKKERKDSSAGLRETQKKKRVP